MIHLDKLEFNDPSEDGLHTCDAGYGLKLSDYPLLERFVRERGAGNTRKSKNAAAEMAP